MGYRNMTCHHLGSARISLPLGQCRDSSIALFQSWLVLLWEISTKMSSFLATVAIQAVFCQITRLATFIIVLIVAGKMANSYVVIASWCIITITQMLSFALVAKWPLLEVPSSLFTSPELSWLTLVSWPTFPLTSYLRLSTRPTRPVLIIRPPRLEPKPSTTTLISHYLKRTWL